MARTIGSLPCGAKIRFGSYCVGNESAHNICWIKMNSDDTIFLSEYIEDFRAFDAQEPPSSEFNYTGGGNNCYSVSNIDQFLNSAEEEWYHPQHDTDKPPEADRIFNGTPYLKHQGFLAYFRKSELDAIIPTSITILDGKRTITRKVFLPSRINIVGSEHETDNSGEKQWEYFENGNTARTTSSIDAIKNTSMDEPPQTHEYWYYWLRTNVQDSVNYIAQDGFVKRCDACYGCLGVRPALALNPEVIVTDEPDEEGYYEVSFSGSESDDISENDLFSIL